MKRVCGLVLALAICAVSLASAQQKMGLFRSPVFVAQPGIIMSFSDEAKRGKGAGDPHFNARFVMALPTSIPRTTIVGIVQWTPFNDPDGDGAHGNNPAFVYGPVVNVVSTKNIAFDIDGLFAYGPTGSVPAKSSYTHKFLVEGDLFLKLGSMMNMASQWNSLNAYAMLAYVITGLDDPADPPGPTPAPPPVETRDRLVLLAGLSLPLAPWKM